MSTHRMAIDLGTSHTVAVVRRGDEAPRALLFDGSPLMPSAVYSEAPRLHVGRDAERLSLVDPSRFEPHPKRRVDDGKVLLGNTEIGVVDMLAALLARVAAEAGTAGASGAGGTVLTCPADWGAQRRNVLLAAAQAAHLGPVHLVDEPVAAATYCIDVLQQQVGVGRPVAVFDFGGGTLDVSVLRRDPDGLRVLSVGGLDDLGGVDIDAALIGHLGQLIAMRSPRVWQRLNNPGAQSEQRERRQFWTEVRGAKEMLSRTAAAPVQVPGMDSALHLTREELERIAGPLIDRAVDETRRVLQRGGVDAGQLAGLFLVGGSSRIPLVASRLHTRFGVAPTVPEQPELPVAYGGLLVASAGGAASQVLLQRQRPLPPSSGPQASPLFAGPAQPVSAPTGRGPGSSPPGLTSAPPVPSSGPPGLTSAPPGPSSGPPGPSSGAPFAPASGAAISYGQPVSPASGQPSFPVSYPPGATSSATYPAFGQRAGQGFGGPPPGPPGPPPGPPGPPGPAGRLSPPGQRRPRRGATRYVVLAVVVSLFVLCGWGGYAVYRSVTNTVKGIANAADGGSAGRSGVGGDKVGGDAGEPTKLAALTVPGEGGLGMTVGTDSVFYAGVSAGKIEVAALGTGDGKERWKVSVPAEPEKLRLRQTGELLVIEGERAASHGGKNIRVVLGAKTGAQKRLDAVDGQRAVGYFGGDVVTETERPRTVQRIDLSSGAVKWKAQVKDSPGAPDYFSLPVLVHAPNGPQPNQGRAGRLPFPLEDEPSADWSPALGADPGTVVLLDEDGGKLSVLDSANGKARATGTAPLNGEHWLAYAGVIVGRLSEKASPGRVVIAGFGVDNVARKWELPLPAGARIERIKPCGPQHVCVAYQASGSNWNVTAIDVSSGKEVWKKTADFGDEPDWYLLGAGLVYGESSFGSIGSPALYDPVTGAKKHGLASGVNGGDAMAGAGGRVVLRAIRSSLAGSTSGLVTTDLATGRTSSMLDIGPELPSHMSMAGDVVAALADDDRKLVVAKAPAVK